MWIWNNRSRLGQMVLDHLIVDYVNARVLEQWHDVRSENPYVGVNSDLVYEVCSLRPELRDYRFNSSQIMFPPSAGDCSRVFWTGNALNNATVWPCQFAWLRGL
jgi:hypothetical protein